MVHESIIAHDSDVSLIPLAGRNYKYISAQAATHNADLTMREQRHPESHQFAYDSLVVERCVLSVSR